MAENLKAKSGDLILFHNGCNPLVFQKEITDVLGTARKYQAALVGQPARDTIKEMAKDGFINRTIDRKKFF
jgi:2-C-methyl-D-erythritol 4-phosphate cytidylyltransferase